MGLGLALAEVRRPVVQAVSVNMDDLWPQGASAALGVAPTVCIFRHLSVIRVRGLLAIRIADRCRLHPSICAGFIVGWVSLNPFGI